MKWSSGEVAVLFGVTPQTIRNWINRPELSVFFSESVRHVDRPRAQSEFIAEDIELCNSIQTMLTQKANWDVIAEQLHSGWRDTNMPARLAIMENDPNKLTDLELVAKLAIANEQSIADQSTIEKRDAEIARLELKITNIEYAARREKDELLERIAQLREDRARDDARKDTLLELYESGRLTPPKPIAGEGK